MPYHAAGEILLPDKVAAVGEGERYFVSAGVGSRKPEVAVLRLHYAERSGGYRHVSPVVAVEHVALLAAGVDGGAVLQLRRTDLLGKYFKFYRLPRGRAVVVRGGSYSRAHIVGTGIYGNGRRKAAVFAFGEQVIDVVRAAEFGLRAPGRYRFAVDICSVDLGRGYAVIRHCDIEIYNGGIARGVAPAVIVGIAEFEFNGIAAHVYTALVAGDGVKFAVRDIGLHVVPAVLNGTYFGKGDSRARDYHCGHAALGDIVCIFKRDRNDVRSGKRRHIGSVHDSAVVGGARIGYHKAADTGRRAVGVGKLCRCLRDRAQIFAAARIYLYAEPRVLYAEHALDKRNVIVGVG